MRVFSVLLSIWIMVACGQIESKQLRAHSHVHAKDSPHLKVTPQKNEEESESLSLAEQAMLDKLEHKKLHAIRNAELKKEEERIRLAELAEAKAKEVAHERLRLAGTTEAKAKPIVTSRHPELGYLLGSTHLKNIRIPEALQALTEQTEKVSPDAGPVLRHDIVGSDGCSLKPNHPRCKENIMHCSSEQFFTKHWMREHCSSLCCNCSELTDISSKCNSNGYLKQCSSKKKVNLKWMTEHCALTCCLRKYSGDKETTK